MAAQTETRPALGRPLDRDRIGRQFLARVHRERDAVVARMVDGFLHLQVELRPADGLADHVAQRHGWLHWRPPWDAAARRNFLRIAALVLDEPRRGLDELEMSVQNG